MTLEHRVTQCDDGEQFRPRVFGYFRTNSGSICALDNGLLNRYPCAWSHLRSFRNFDCSSVSTPSAMTFMSSECPSEMMVETMDMLSASLFITMMNERSILSVLTGSRARYPSDE